MLEDIDLNAIHDEIVLKQVRQLLNLVEKLTADVRALQEENQKLQDEINLCWLLGSSAQICVVKENHILIHDDTIFERVAKEYTAYFNQERPHQGIDQRIPDQYDQTRSKPTRGRSPRRQSLGDCITVIPVQHI
jgi:hypothetical protein